MVKKSGKQCLCLIDSMHLYDQNCKECRQGLISVGLLNINKVMKQAKNNKDFFYLPHSLHHQTISNRFYVSDTILSGNYGAIYKGIDMSVQPHTVVLIKCINMAQIKMDCTEKQFNMKLKIVQRQALIMSKQIHSKILPCIKYYQNEEDCIIVTKYCNEGTLNEIVQHNDTLQLAHAINVLKQISAPLSALHNSGILHTFLALHSIHIHNGECYIGDLGATNVIMSADQVVESFDNFYSDFYDLGVVLYQMLCPKGNLRERRKNAKKLDLNKTKFKLKNQKQAPLEVKIFLKQCLSKELTWSIFANNKLFSKEMKTDFCFEYIRMEDQDIRELIVFPLQKQKQIIEFAQQYPEDLQQYCNYQEPSFSQYSKCSSVVLSSTEDCDQESKKYKRLLKLHLKKNIWEFVRIQLIQQIERIKPFTLTKTNKIQLMYMLSYRCFMEMATLKDEYQVFLNEYPGDMELKHLVEKQLNICKIYSDIFESYGKRLRQQEGKFKNIFKDFVKNIVFYTEMRKKNELMQDVENRQNTLKRSQHIKWIQNQLNKNIQIPKSQEIWNLYRKFKVFEKIVNLTLEDKDKKGFQQAVKQLISKIEI